jgi:glyoxylase-like metal-dependent hydrolase (beta-lactamase superfamily II)/rhodanese-related sulfurtransferase
MKVEQIYTGCLAHGAYYIESEGEAAIIDPLRETQQYVEKAKADGAQIKYIFETHFHADFVSGHLDLAKKTGAHIVYGPSAKTSFDIIVGEDQQEFKIGKVTVKLLHTPGHTMESSCFLLKDENGKDYAIFSGDTLFIGDVGRPDLAQKSGEITQEDLAGWLFDSLRNKVMTLADDVIVYPGHGAGSACGKNMSDETWDTIGHQKQTNYALRADMTREEFIEEVTDGLMPPPQYFPKNAKINKMGYDSFEDIMERGMNPLSPRAFEAAATEEEALMLDVREKEDFSKGFIPNSVLISLGGSFAPWAGALIPDLKQPILIIAEPGKEEEAITRLARVGHDNVIGYLDGGFESWKKEGREIDTVQSIDVPTFERMYKENPELNVLDVRKIGEYSAEHVENSVLFSLDYINDNFGDLDRSKEYILHCRSGYRSTIAASILQARGFIKLKNVLGTFEDISKSEVPTTDYVCPSMLKA